MIDHRVSLIPAENGAKSLPMKCNDSLIELPFPYLSLSLGPLCSLEEGKKVEFTCTWNSGAAVVRCLADAVNETHAMHSLSPLSVSLKPKDLWQRVRFSSA